MTSANSGAVMVYTNLVSSLPAQDFTIIYESYTLESQVGSKLHNTLTGLVSVLACTYFDHFLEVVHWIATSGEKWTITSSDSPSNGLYIGDQ